MSEPKVQKKSNKDKGIAMILYGVPGIGKTRLIGTGPKTLIIRPPTDHTESIVDEDTFDELVVNSWAEMQAAFQWLHQGAYKKYDWVWLDSLSLWQDAGLRDLFDAAVQRKPSREEFGLDKGEYGINQFRITTWIANMVGQAKEGRFNFGIVCHTMEWFDPVNEKMVWAPNIQGREGLMMQKICGMMNAVAYYYAMYKNEKMHRVLRTRADKVAFIVKDQIEMAPKPIIDPTMADLRRNNDKSIKRQPKRRKKRRS